MNPLGVIWSGLWSILRGPLNPPPPLAEAIPSAPLRLPDIFGGFRLTPLDLGPVQGWGLASRVAGLRGFLHQNEEGLWTVVILNYDEQPRTISQLHYTPEAALVQFLEER